MKGGEVFINDLFLYREQQSTKEEPVWERVGEMARGRTRLGGEKGGNGR